MGYCSKKRRIKKFWENPLVNICYTISIIAFVAGLFGIFALIGGADTLLFTIASIALGVAMIVLGNILNKRNKKQ